MINRQMNRNIALRLVILSAHCERYGESAAKAAVGCTDQMWAYMMRGSKPRRQMTIERIAWLLAIPAEVIQYGTLAQVVAADVPVNANWLRAYDRDKPSWLEFRKATQLPMKTPE